MSMDFLPKPRVVLHGGLTQARFMLPLEDKQKEKGIFIDSLSSPKICNAKNKKAKNFLQKLYAREIAANMLSYSKIHAHSAL